MVFVRAICGLHTLAYFMGPKYNGRNKNVSPQVFVRRSHLLGAQLFIGNQYVAVFIVGIFKIPCAHKACKFLPMV